ncbi:ABC transporter C family member 3-like [Fagus crenata]
MVLSTPKVKLRENEYEKEMNKAFYEDSLMEHSEGRVLIDGVIKKCHLEEAVRQDQRLLDATGKVVEYESPAQLLKDKPSSFSKLMTKFLRRSSKSYCLKRTVIYGTHQVEILYAADIVQVMKDGRLEHSGNYGDHIADHRKLWRSSLVGPITLPLPENKLEGWSS